MNYIDISNQTKEDLEEYISILNELFVFATKKENLDNVSFSIVFVDNKLIHEINKTYRNIDRPTDVISFALEDNMDIKTEIRLLGDIYISIDKAKEQSLEYGHSLKREICFLAVHGFYHLLGYDHMTKEDEEIMFKKQDEILEEFKISRN